jgi:hypothetical protein
MRASSLFILMLLASACVTKQERKDEVHFNGATFGMEAFAKETLETTLRHTELYFELGSTGRKYFQTRETNCFGYFPVDSAIIQKINPVIIDTTIRYPDQYPPSQSTSTLYLSPSHFTKEEFNLVTAFIKQEYTKPDTKNKVLEWLNYSGQEAMDSVLWNSIYAVAYVDLASIQPTFKGEDENHWATILVNRTVDVAGHMGTLQTRTSFFIRHDTLFYHEADTDLFQQLKKYKNESGQTITDYCVTTKAISNLDRFYMPPFQ